MLSNAKTIAVVANGVIHDFNQIARLIKPYEKVVAVDGGLVHCHRMGILPDLIVGDFDSIPDHLLPEYAHVAEKRFLKDKDETDLELALQAIYEPWIEKITIFGGLEGRTDHTLGNLHLIRRYPSKVRVETEDEIIFSIHGSAIIDCFVLQNISFIPLGGSAKGVSSQGLKWELNKDILDQNFMSISNVCLKSPIHITIGEGDLLCCLLKTQVGKAAQ